MFFATVWTQTRRDVCRARLVFIIEAKIGSSLIFAIYATVKHLYANAFFTSEQLKRYKLWSCQKICDALHYLLNNIHLAKFLIGHLTFFTLVLKVRFG